MSWVQLGMDIDGENADDLSGTSISINEDGSIVAIGAIKNDDNGNFSGHVRIYEYVGTNWVQLGADIDGENIYSESGSSVSISADGTRVAIGSPFSSASVSYGGQVRVYEYDGVNWSLLGTSIGGENAYDYSGSSVTISADGTRVAIGAPRNDGINGTGSGHVRIYEYNSIDWVQVGSDIDGENSGDRSGFSVSINDDGTRVAIGAIFNVGINGNGSESGHVRIYDYNGSAWVQLGEDIDGESVGDNSGISISINSDGTRVAIGATLNDGTNGTVPNAGHVRVYEYDGSNWVQLGDDIDGEATNDNSGIVSINGAGTRVAIGARGNDGNNGTVPNAGHVRVYDFDGTNWIQIGTDIDGENATDLSGEAVSISSDGTRVAIGATLNDGVDGLSSRTGHVRVFELEAVETPGAGGDPHIKPIIGRQYDLPHNETSYMLLDIPKQNLSIVGACWKLPESQYAYQLSKINNRTKKNAIKTLLKEATYFKYIKIQLNNETVIYDMDTLEQVKYEPSKFKTHTLEKDSATFDQIKESKIVRSKEGLFGSSINYTSIKCIEKIVSLKLSNGTVIKVRLAKDRKNILYRNSISLVDIGDIKITTLHGALVRKEIIEVAFNKDFKQAKTI